MTLISRLTMVMLAMTLATLARAELTIEITQGVENATPIAIVPFKGPSREDNIGSIVSDDLTRSGVFKPLSEDRLPARPSSNAEVVFADWKASTAEYLVVGQVNPTSDNRLEIRFELFSVTKEQRLLGETMTVGPEKWRDAAHFIADRIFEKITGIRGAFSTRIMYVSQARVNGKPQYRLEIADSDGHRAASIFSSGEPILSPAWSPDARQVAYVSFENGRPAIFIQNISTQQRTKVADYAGLNGAPAFSPDGRQLALTLSRDGNPEIYVLDIDTRSLKRVTNHYAIDTEPRWAPDGKSLIFTSDRSGNPQIYRADLSSGNTTRLTFDGNFNARADISPDGRYLAMVHRERGQQFQIAVLDLKTGVMSTLTETPLDESPSFSPNGVMLVYATRKGSDGVLGIVSLDGRFKVRLPARQGEVREPAWSPFLR